MNHTPFRITRIASHAVKFIAKRDRKSQKEIADAFDFMRNVSPVHHSNPKTIRRLHGEFEGLYRYRVGKIRIIYSIDKVAHIIEILNIDDRGDVYK